ncbi:4-alpha-glucanotransferase [Streptomyces sp. NPDC095613]|uniref:4-alpha-glucanotransferase n=1 Tax=Streptomyces sp. NPDC095613 TaxID=3155540 RepID=UPI003331F2CF
MGLAGLAELHGVATSYEPSPGVTVPVPDDTVVSVLAALGVDASTPEAVTDALTRAKSALASRLLPPTLVVWRAQDGTAPELPTALAALPPGSTLRVATEEGERVELPQAGATVPVEAEEQAGPGPRAAAWARLPLGVHRLAAGAPDGRTAEVTLIVAPGHVPRPPARTHGFLVQLYSLLSRRSWGMGDLGDLAELAAWSGRALGAGFVQINPLHAAVPGAPTDPSPYRPSSRRFPDPVHVRVEAVPEYAYVRGADRARLDELTEKAAALRESVLATGAPGDAAEGSGGATRAPGAPAHMTGDARTGAAGDATGDAAAGASDRTGLIDRDAVWAVKRAALEILATVPLGPGRHAAYRDFLASQGQALVDHATWCALAEAHGPRPREWPEPLRDPRSAGTAAARRELRDRVDFHCRLAWLTDEQLGAASRAAEDAGMAVGIVHDLAVGVHPDGADAWAQRDVFAAGMSVGAPPDAFNAHGQDWGLPPWRPDVLAASAYAPYRGLLRGLLRHAGALRIDHVMGLFRLWWVPEGQNPTRGTYVRYDAEAMLAVLVLEAHRAGAAVIGEDLGTVEPGVREALERRGVLGTSVLWFERDWTGTGRPLPPGSWREGCVATATTHDLPSTAARLTGEHVALRHRLGLLTRPLEREQADDRAETAEWRACLARLGLLPGGTRDTGDAGDTGDGGDEAERAEEEAIRAVYRFLLSTPARMVGIWLPDTLGDRRPQNLPGTWDQYPNWRLPLADAKGRPVTLEDLAAAPRLRRLMEVFPAATAPPRARPV